MTRKITTEAIAIIDKRLKGNELAKEAYSNGRPRQLFIEAVKACVGIKEVASNKGKEVEQFLKVTYAPSQSAGRITFCAFPTTNEPCWRTALCQQECRSIS